MITLFDFAFRVHRTDLVGIYTDFFFFSASSLSNFSVLYFGNLRTDLNTWFYLVMQRSSLSSLSISFFRKKKFCIRDCIKKNRTSFQVLVSNRSCIAVMQFSSLLINVINKYLFFLYKGFNFVVSGTYNKIIVKMECFGIHWIMNRCDSDLIFTQPENRHEIPNCNNLMTSHFLNKMLIKRCFSMPDNCMEPISEFEGIFFFSFKNV